MKDLMSRFAAPDVMKNFHMTFTVIFMLLIPPSMLLWSQSVPYLVAISVWANFVGHLSAWQAARGEKRQNEIEDDRQEETA